MSTSTGKVVDLLDADGNLPAVQEAESCNVTGTFKNGATTIPKSALVTLLFTLYDQVSGQIINQREHQDILDANGGEISEAGVLTLRLQPADNAIVGSGSAGRLEAHIGRLTWTWTDGALTRTGVQEFRLHVEKLATPTPIIIAGTAAQTLPALTQAAGGQVLE